MELDMSRPAFKKTLFWEMFVLLALTGILNQIATAYHLYWFIYEFDSIVHFLAGTAVSLFFLWLYFFSGFFNPPQRSMSRFLIISIIGTLFISVCWEIFELSLGEIIIYKAEYTYDTMMDFIMNFLGAVVACFYGYVRELKNEQS